MIVRNFYITGAMATISLIACAGIASAQDLGSSNKLFGGEKKTAKRSNPLKEKAPAQAEKTTPVRKKTAKPKSGVQAKAPVTKKRAAANRPAATARKRSTSTPRAVESQAVIAPAPTVIAPRGGRSGDVRTRRVNPDPAVAERKVTVIDRKGGVTVSREQVTIGATKRPAATERPAARRDERVDQLIERADDARSEGDLAAAQNLYLRAKEINSKDARVYRGLAAVYTEQQNLEAAENAHRETLRLVPDDQFTLVSLGNLLARPVAAPNLSERYDEAETLLRRALKVTPRNAFASDRLARSLELQGDLGPETESSYRQAIALAPEYAPSYARLARMLRQKGRSAESSKLFDEAIHRANDAHMKIEVAEVLAGENRTLEAISLLDAALANSPKNVKALNLLGRALTTAGNFPEAERTLRRSLAVSASNFDAYSALASLQLRQRNYDAAENTLNNASRFASSFEKRRLATQFEMVGDGFSREGNISRAERAYRQAKVLDPDRETLTGKIARTR